VRIIRSIEEKQFRRQRTGVTDTIESEWIWATNMPATKLNTSHALTIGHRRWNIENQGFNQIVQAYKGVPPPSAGNRQPAACAAYSMPDIPNRRQQHQAPNTPQPHRVIPR